MRVPLLVSTVLLGAFVGCVTSAPPECDDVVCTAGRCELDSTGSPQCVCGAVEQAQNLVCEIELIELPDADDQPTGATLLVPPVGPLPAELGRRSTEVGDVDYYKVQVEAGHVMRFTVAVAPGVRVPEVRWEGIDIPTRQRLMPELGVQDFWFRSQTSGVLYLAVVGRGWSTAVPYTYALADFGTSPARSSGPLGAGGEVSGEILPFAASPHEYVLAGAPGELLRLSCEGGAAISIYPDWSAYATFDGATVVELTSGTSVMTVSGTPPVWYRCAATAAGHDDFSDGYMNPGVVALTGDTFSFETENHGDHDYVQLSLPGSDYFALSCTPSCTVEPARFEAPGSVSPTLTLTGEMGSHVVTVESLGPDDHGDTAGDATSITVGEEFTRRYEVAMDVDAFAFTPEPLRIYRLGCPRGFCSGYWSFEGTSSGRFTRSTYGGAWYFKHTAADQRLIWNDLGAADAPVGPFPMSLQQVGTDDYPDSFAEGAVITLDETRAATLDMADDLDVFRIYLTPGTYAVQETTSESQAYAWFWTQSILSPGIIVSTADFYELRVGYREGVRVPSVESPWTVTFKVVVH